MTGAFGMEIVVVTIGASDTQVPSTQLKPVGWGSVHVRLVGVVGGGGALVGGVVLMGTGKLALVGVELIDDERSTL